MENRKDRNNILDREVDFLEIAKIVWMRRYFLLLMICIFFVIGLITIILTPNTYTSSSIFLPQNSDQNRGMPGNLGGLASLAGVNMGNAMSPGTEIRPSLYPKIIKSVKFKRELIKSPITIDEEGNTLSYQAYYESIHDPGIGKTIRKYTIGLPSLFKNSEHEDGFIDTVEYESRPIKLTKSEIEHFDRIENQLKVQYDDKEGTVELSFSMPYPIMAAEMAKNAQDLLQKEIIEFKIKNAGEQLNFIQERFNEKKIEFREAQQRLGNFRDRNQNITSSTAMNQLQTYEAEYNFAFNIYTEMAKQLEQSKIQVSKDTPVFSIIQPAIIPSGKSAPKGLFVIIIFIIIGLVSALAFIFILQIIRGLKNQF